MVYFFGLEYGQLLEFLLKYIIAYFGMYLYLRKLNLSSIGAFLGGMTFAFSSAMVVWGGWSHSDVTAYAPFLFILLKIVFANIKEIRNLLLAILYYFQSFYFLCL